MEYHETNLYMLPYFSSVPNTTWLKLYTCFFSWSVHFHKMVVLTQNLRNFQTTSLTTLSTAVIDFLQIFGQLWITVRGEQITEAKIFILSSCRKTDHRIGISSNFWKLYEIFKQIRILSWTLQPPEFIAFGVKSTISLCKKLSSIERTALTK